MEPGASAVNVDDLAEVLGRLRDKWDDQEARNLLVPLCAGTISGGIRAVFGPGSADEADIAQETWIAFFKERRDYVLTNSAVCKSFLFRTARGSALHRIRSRQREV